MAKYLLCAALLFVVIEQVARCEPPCTVTPLSRLEAERLVMAVPEAVTAEKMGGKLSVVAWKPAHPNASFYYFMLLSTVSSPTTPLNNGMLGYFSVDRETGRVINVAGEKTVGKELERLQARLRVKHCISQE
jgi:hypothetical protein